MIPLKINPPVLQTDDKILTPVELNNIHFSENVSEVTEAKATMPSVTTGPSDNNDSSIILN